jgi:rhodanese-related sulfurtransferase
MSKFVTANELKKMLNDGAELALLDVREEGQFSQRHLLYAAPVPLSRLEILLPQKLPRPGARTVVVDDDGGDLARRAAARMTELGYDNVAVLEGGNNAWEAAGQILFSGVHVPSKAFGEFVEHTYGTPHISADELHAKMAAGEDLIVLDSRPLDEFRIMNIPGGIDCPGAELAYRVHDLAPDPDTLVVVNCAGRTRSIIGAQSLINAGIPNRVVALENGTMGWHLAGLELERGNERMAPPPSENGLQTAKSCAASAAERFGVTTIDRATLDAWRADENRTLYVLDVRDPDEYHAGHPVGVASAPGGQLVQSTEAWCPVLGARVVLLDDTGVRATMTASWLRQMGWDVHLLEGGIDGFELESGPWQAAPLGIGDVARNEINPSQLKDLIDAGDATVIDLAVSVEYEAGHIPDAYWAVRARLASVLPSLPQTANLVFTSEDGIVATLAAPEASELTAAKVHVLAGGTKAWQEAGLPLTDGLENLADQRDDVWLKPYQSGGSVEDRMREYLTWETDLVANIERDGDHRFVVFPNQ